MLLASLPPALIPFTQLLRPLIYAIAMLFILEKLACISDSILVYILAIALHDCVDHLAVVGATVNPQVDPITTDMITVPLASECAPVCPRVFTSSLLFASAVVSLVAAAVGPCFFTSTMLLVHQPLANIDSSLYRRVNPETICSIVAPLTIIDIPVHMIKLTLATGSSIRPRTLVFGFVLPLLRPLSMTKTT